MKSQKSAFTLYIILSGIFISSLVTCNLIFQKFFNINILGYQTQLSVGLLAYPITFLVTDVISEIFGQKKAQQVVIAGFCAAIFTFIVITISSKIPSFKDSPVNDQIFSQVFGLTGPAVLASMTAYLIAQYIDVKIFHFWKRVTKGKHLWIRNNFSTIPSQTIDSCTVIGILVLAKVFTINQFIPLVVGALLFKIVVAAIDTIPLYIIVNYIRKKYKLKKGEEINL
ncbi:MAG: hypothetical protein CMP58_04485 [Flavobacteriales bacterium]|nr:hypothetical protein [Flavobacteriales bacterium]